MLIDIRKPKKHARLRERQWKLREEIRTGPKKAMVCSQKRKSFTIVLIKTSLKLSGKVAHDQISLLKVSTEHICLRNIILGSFANVKPQLASLTSVSLPASPMKLVIMLAVIFEHARKLI